MARMSHYDVCGVRGQIKAALENERIISATALVELGY